MTVQEIRDRLRGYILDSFLSGPDGEAPGDGDDLFRRLDSLQVLRMVVQLEPLFGVKVANSELTAENLGSIEKIAGFVVRRRGANGADAATVRTSPGGCT
jgi:acyl carrier protein